MKYDVLNYFTNFYFFIVSYTWCTSNVIIISPKIVISLSLRVACAKLKMDANFHFPIYWTKFFLNSGLSHSDLDTVLSQQARASLSAKDKD